MTHFPRRQGLNGSAGAAGAPTAGLAAGGWSGTTSPSTGSSDAADGPALPAPELTARRGRRWIELGLQLSELKLHLPGGGRLVELCLEGSDEPDRSVRVPEARSSSTAPALACIWAILSWARCMARPVSLIDSEMPDTPRRSSSEPGRPCRKLSGSPSGYGRPRRAPGAVGWSPRAAPAAVPA